MRRGTQPLPPPSSQCLNRRFLHRVLDASRKRNSLRTCVQTAPKSSLLASGFARFQEAKQPPLPPSPPHVSLPFNQLVTHQIKSILMYGRSNQVHFKFVTYKTSTLSFGNPCSSSEALRSIETVSARGARKGAVFAALFRAPCPQVIQ